MLAQNIAVSAPIGYCQRIGVIDNEQGEIRALLTNDVSSPHLSLGVRVACMGAGNHRHEHHGYDGNHHRNDNGYDGHHRHEHHGYDGNHHRHHHGHEHHGYDGNLHKQPTKHPAT